MIFPNGTDIHFENYDQYYNVVNPDSLNLLLESLQNQTVAELSGTLINHNNSLIEQKDTFRVTIKLDGFKTAYQQMLTDCQSL